jgi:hypothetical protein
MCFKSPLEDLDKLLDKLSMSQTSERSRIYLKVRQLTQIAVSEDI